jgi:hypothetical protein
MLSTRPRVLVAVGPPLLADLLRRALARSGELDVVVRAASPWGLRRWDVAVLPCEGIPEVRARYVVCLPGQLPARMTALASRPLGQVRTASDFESLVSLVVRLCHDGNEIDLRDPERDVAGPGAG